MSGTKLRTAGINGIFNIQYPSNTYVQVSDPDEKNIFIFRRFVYSSVSIHYTVKITRN